MLVCVSVKEKMPIAKIYIENADTRYPPQTFLACSLLLALNRAPLVFQIFVLSSSSREFVKEVPPYS